MRLAAPCCFLQQPLHGIWNKLCVKAGSIQLSPYQISSKSVEACQHQKVTNYILSHKFNINILVWLYCLFLPVMFCCRAKAAITFSIIATIMKYKKYILKNIYSSQVVLPFVMWRASSQIFLNIYMNTYSVPCDRASRMVWSRYLDLTLSRELCDL